ncbi:MAG: sugar-binding domain-containing protein [Segetibacter sp.]
MKLIYTIFLSFFFISSFAQQKGEQTLSLNGEWKFKTDSYAKGELSNWFAPGLNDKEWDSMTVPGNWDLRNEYAHYAGKAWYRKNVNIPANWKGKTIRLLFEGVNFDSKVWINGKLAGTNNIGYLPFEFDVSKLLNDGSTNTIAVVCDNTYRLGAVWNWGGIRRPVKIIATENVYLTDQFISPSVNLNNHTAEVAIRVLCSNKTNAAKKVKGNVFISAINGFTRTLPFTINVAANTFNDVVVKTSLNKNEVHLWNCDDPFLYQSQVTLTNGEQVLHQLKDRFGLRKIELDNKNYTLKLNGESIRPMGFNLVPDDRTKGSTLPLWRVKQDVDLMKSLGANMARLTHLPLTKEMYDYLDEKGILVYPEIPLWGLHQLVDKNNPVAKQWLQRLVTNHYNHASIIGWSVGNEIGESPGVMEYVEDAIKYVKSIDTTRLGVMISHTATRPVDPIQFSDIGLVNKYGTGIGVQADNMHKLHPEKILFYSEYGYGQLSENLDADVDAKGMMDSIRFKQYLIGGSLWTFNDYRSSYVGTKEFSENRPWGIVDVFRQKKKAWYSFRKEYAPIRELKVEANVKDKTAAITITPRKLLDLPAYILKDYVLLWEGFNESNKITGGGFIKLPVITPGDKDIQQTIPWNISGLSHIKIELVTPQNYSVYDTTLYFKKPEAPRIIYAKGVRTDQNNTPANSGAIRIIFDRKDATTLYKVKYGITDLSKETAPTLNNYIDIPKLPFNETYQIAVAGINAAGESNVSEVRKVKVETGFAPPVIYFTEPADKGFYVGYTTDKDDYVFRIQYSAKAGDYTNAPTIQSSTRGVMFVPGLTNGKQYYFRMSRIKDNNYRTDWSEEHTVIPDGQHMPATPNLQGIIRTGDEAMVVFKSVKKAIGYTVQYRLKNSGEWRTIKINAAEINHFKISGLDVKGMYEFRMSSENMYGQSGFTEAVFR